MNKNLQSIGARAFDSCSSLVSVTIPNKVTSIDGYVFNKCKSLQKIVIGKKVEMIDSSAFDNCESLYSISFLGKCPTLTNRYDITPIFVDSANLQKISVPKKYVSAYKNVFTNYKIVYNK